MLTGEERPNLSSPNTGVGESVPFAPPLTSFTSSVRLARKWRDELAGGEIIEGAEAAGELVGAQAAVAVEAAYKFHGVALCLQ